MDLDYFILAGILLPVAGFSILATYLGCRQSLALRLSLMIASTALTAAFGGFILGKTGFSLVGIGLTVTIVLVLGVGPVILLLRQVVRPLRQVGYAAARLAQGDLSQPPDIRSKDEMGQMAASLTGAATYLQIATQAVREVSAGNLAVEVTPRSDQDEFGRAFSRMVTTLRERIGQIGQSVWVMAQITAATHPHGGAPGVRTNPAQPYSDLEDLAVALGDIASYWQNATGAVSQLAAGNLAVEVMPRSDQGMRLK